MNACILNSVELWEKHLTKKTIVSYHQHHQTGKTVTNWTIMMNFSHHLPNLFGCRWKSQRLKTNNPCIAFWQSQWLNDRWSLITVNWRLCFWRKLSVVKPTEEAIFFVFQGSSGKAKVKLGKWELSMQKVGKKKKCWLYISFPWTLLVLCAFLVLSFATLKNSGNDNACSVEQVYLIQFLYNNS